MNKLSNKISPPVTVIVPVFNEEAGLHSVLAELKEFSLRWPAKVEILVIDDGSTDRTAEIAMNANIRVLQNPANFGYGASLARGIAEASQDVIAIIDGDGSYSPQDLEPLIREFCRGFDMVIGSRSGQYYHKSILKRITRKIFRFMAEFVVGMSIPDVNSGLRVFRRQVVLNLAPSLSKGFSFSSSLTIMLPLRGYHIAFVPINYRARRGKSKVRTIHDALRATQILIETVVLYNPLKLFLLIQCCLWILAIICVVVYSITHEIVWGTSAILLFTEGILAFMFGILALGNIRR